jgi:hypothetical protein
LKPIGLWKTDPDNRLVYTVSDQFLVFCINFWSSVDQNLDKLIVTSGKIHLLMMVIKSSVKLQAILY